MRTLRKVRRDARGVKLPSQIKGGKLNGTSIQTKYIWSDKSYNITTGWGGVDNVTNILD